MNKKQMCKGCIDPNEIGCDDCELVDNEIDLVNHPPHYTTGNIEVIDFIEDKELGFHLGNAIKYISRAGKKSKETELQDLKKAIWYIERKIGLLKNNE